MFCRIYASFDNNRVSSLIGEIANVIDATIDNSKYIEKNGYSIEIRYNDDWHCEKAKSYPDGFLYFPYSIEIDIEDFISEEEAACEVNKILEVLWNNKYPAIASCSFEELLKLKGGYKSNQVTW